MKATLAVVAVLAGLSAASPLLEHLHKRVSRYDCEYYNTPSLGAIAERLCGVFGVSTD